MPAPYILYEAPIANADGAPALIQHRSRWVLLLGTESGTCAVDVSDQFAHAWLAEFAFRQATPVHMNSVYFDFSEAWWRDPDFADERERRLAKLARALDSVTDGVAARPAETTVDFDSALRELLGCDVTIVHVDGPRGGSTSVSDGKGSLLLRVEGPRQDRLLRAVEVARSRKDGAP